MDGPSLFSAGTSLFTHSVHVNVSPTCSVPKEDGRVRRGERINLESKREDFVASAAAGLIFDVVELEVEGRGVCCESEGLESLPGS